MTLYHCTTPKKIKRYETSGRIISPVRGFSTLLAAQKWCQLTGRTIILSFEANKVWKLPDHHNQYGTAWWNEGDIINYSEVLRIDEPLFADAYISPVKQTYSYDYNSLKKL